MTRPRPPSSTTIMLRNPCVRDGLVSSDPIGMHTGILADRQISPRSRPSTAPAPMCLDDRRLRRTSDAIGTHPPRQPIDRRNTAAMLYEAQFAHSFGEKGRDLGAVLAGADTVAAAQFKREATARAQMLSAPVHRADTTITDNTNLRADGTRQDEMAFDAVYSNKHVNKDTESAINHGTLVPKIDPRCITRPKGLAYGDEHRVSTAAGPRAVLPSRSFMRIGEGPGRATDF